PPSHLTPHSSPTRRSSDLLSFQSGPDRRPLRPPVLVLDDQQRRFELGTEQRKTRIVGEAVGQRRSPRKGRVHHPQRDVTDDLGEDRKCTRLNSSHRTMSYG